MPSSQHPQGALTGRIVYCSGGHGWTASTTGSGSPWYTQRGDNFDVVEDLGNSDQLAMFIAYAFNAGATIVPFRPVGSQVNEVVVDNDDAGAVFTPSGSWANGVATPFYGTTGDIGYRAATKSATETATATYTPTIPAAGYYPVYTWALQGSNRVNDQLYRINHTGGASTVRINHHRVGQGWIYLGTYYFNSGTGGSVVISNQSSDPTGTAVIADAIRFGNGMGDVDRGFGISGKPREEECARYWVEREIGVGGDTTNYDNPSLIDQDDNVGAPIRQAVDMNVQTDGLMSDRIYISFHTNAPPGAIGLYNGNNDPGSKTLNQFRWAELVGREVNDDLFALNGQLEVPWINLGPNPADVTLDRTDIEFGEINNNTIQNEFDATIIESGGHGDSNDAINLRNPNARNWIARASYQAMVRYFNEFGGGPLVFLPEPVRNLRVRASAPGQATLDWTAPVVDAIGGQAATGYRVFRSSDGYGFDAGTVVPGGATTFNVGGLAANQIVFFRVAATNAGGESLPSETVAVRVNGSAVSTILIVNGFDRFSRTLNPRQTSGPGIGGTAGGSQTFDRVKPRLSNSFDYTVQAAQAIGAVTPARGFDSCLNEAITGGQVALGNYNTVIWLLGEESTTDEAFSAAEQTAVSAFLSSGRNLFVTGSEIAWDLDSQGSAADKTFIHGPLHTNYVGDDAGTYIAVAAAGGIFVGNSSLTITDGTQGGYNVEAPDRISPNGTGAVANITYTGGTADTGGIQYNGSAGGGRLVMLGFPFEAIVDASDRAEVMTDVLNFFGTTVPAELSGFIAY